MRSDRIRTRRFQVGDIAMIKGGKPRLIGYSCIIKGRGLVHDYIVDMHRPHIVEHVNDEDLVPLSGASATYAKEDEY